MLMRLQVNTAQRYAKMRAHTATHLLHATLTTILSDTKQAGSLVDEDYLRFDFHADQSLTEKQLQSIENDINQYIYEAYPVSIQEMSYDKAIAMGAKAFFEEKYGDTVNVVTVGDDTYISVELCGGTHVSNTSQIGACKILSQESVASGIKRITAVTGPKIVEKLQTVEAEIHHLAHKLGVQPVQVEQKIDKILKEYEELQMSYESLQSKVVITSLESLGITAPNNDVFSKIVDISGDTSLDSVPFKSIVQQAKLLRQDETVIVYNTQGNFAIIVGNQQSAKDIAAKLGLKGGGNDDLVQGRDKEIAAKIS